MKISGIYQIQSKVKPERIYIGSAVNIKKRWHNHNEDLRKNNHRNSRLQNHYNKYGKEDFVFTILIGCNKEDLIRHEQYFIDALNPYFNICRVANSLLGTKRTQEVCDKMGKTHIGQTAWNKGLKGSIPWNKGKKGMYSEEAIIKMSSARIGRKDSLETRNKKSAANKGKRKSEAYCKYLSERNKKNGAIPPSRKGKFKNSEIAV